MFFPVSLNDDVEGLITNEVLGLPTTPTQEEIKALTNKRPYWSD